jgi:site-specific recombinase XerD
LQLKAYSDSTIRTYRNEFSVFLQTLGKVPAKDLTVERIKDYLVYCQQTLKLSENTIHSRMNALKFYYENVLGREKFFFDIPRPKKPLLLPKILNESELKRMFSAVKNIKHKAILFTAYGAGLRVGEVVRLRICDIDSKRMEIFVQRAKGKKDRVVNLSMLVLDILRQYIKLERPRPAYYLFTGPDGRGPYSERSAQKIFQRAKDMAGIKKEVGFHSLRHSFATHLLEKGIDVKYIKELLGHFDIRTTERYLHVSNDRLINIVSPLDSLYLDE